jgi:hypothetical protein
VRDGEAHGGGGHGRWRFLNGEERREWGGVNIGSRVLR